MVATTGNDILPPPRLTGDSKTDTAALTSWFQDVYESLVVGSNVIGTLPDHETRIAALEAKAAALEARNAALEGTLADIAGLAQLAGPASGTYDATQIAGIINKVNDIIAAAGGS